ncbi:flavodoxin family protein [Ramlibacter sp. Leaf400]|uniref:flavodoxin family protein n=1 Tax=Ramlibacter sp. Leaf400 TaxID=1736365 RepID=UPI0006FBF719|nr:hypothetical protein [Ramlibacter sp. Leaf400]KQT10860.1 flavodoxin [Ramlibacter sp. Leaf400]
MDSIMVVCYSYTGISRRAAQLLCSHHGWPLGEITDATPRGTWRCVLDSLLRRQPGIGYQGPDPGDFRTVVLVAPIWMYRLAGPMRSFVVRHREALRRVAVITTMNSVGASNAIGEIAHLLGHGIIDSAAFTAREIEDGSGTARLIAFGDELQPGSAASQRVRQPAWTAPAA